MIKELKNSDTGFGLLIESDAGYISPIDPRNVKFIEEMSKVGNGETHSTNIEIVEPLELYVILQKHSTRNQNGRVYPQAILEREINNYQLLIKERRSFGEAEHPSETNINSDRISHLIKETWWEGKTLMGKIEFILSPGFIKSGIISCAGDRIANYLRRGFTIGVSSRGTGSLKDVSGVKIVQEDYQLICWDVVIIPSTPGSWIFNSKEEAKPFMESVESLKDENFINKFLND
jgi:hypothetical protein